MTEARPLPLRVWAENQSRELLSEVTQLGLHTAELEASSLDS